MPTSDDDARPELRVEILGPLRLLVDGELVEVRGGRRRAMLALLALARGRVVPFEVLIDSLWGEEPPENARQALHSLLSRLRGHLGAHAARLEREGDGYRLRLDEPELDAAEARALADRGRDAARHDPSAGVALLGQALDLWRGPALSEFGEVEALAADAVSLTELQLSLEEELLAAELARGGAATLVERATTAATAQPTREERQLLLMRVLARSGRPADAMRVGSEYRRQLAERTGLDPSPALAELEGAIASGLETEPDVDRTSEAPPTAEQATSTPPPRYRAGLLGREAELAELGRLIDDQHLVAVVGPPGVGKTRLAAEVAHRLIGERGVDLTYIALASVGADASLDTTLAGALHVRVSPTQTARSASIERLSVAPHVLVLDNCEHVLGGVRDLVEELLAACPELRVVLTSRAPTGLADECVFRLAPLDVAPVDGPASQLFVDRARRARPDLELGVDEQAQVADIVRQLDGLPLAIELAAGRLSTLALDDLAGRLDRAIDILGGPAPDSRRRTLRSTLEWSYELLDPNQQRLLRYLAQFADGVDLDGIERLSDSIGLPAGGMVELAALVDASLVDAQLAGAPRYRMLETIRALAVDHQRAIPDETEQARRAMLDWAVATAAELDAQARTASEPEADRRLRREVANLRAAQHAALELGDLDAAVALAVQLDVPSAFRDLPELWSWSLRLVDWPGADEHPRRVELLGAAAEAAWLQGDLDRAATLAQAGIERDEGCARCLHALATVSMFQGDPALALELWQRAADIDQMYLGTCALAAGYADQLDIMWDTYRRAIRWGTEHGSLSDLAFTHYVAGEFSEDDAETHYGEAISLAQRAGANFVEGVARVGLSSRHARAGRDEAALRGFDEVIRYWRGTGNWTQQWTTLRNLAVLLERRGDPDTAALIVASASVAAEASADLRAIGGDDVPAVEPVGRGEAVRTALLAIERQLAH